MSLEPRAGARKEVNIPACPSCATYSFPFSSPADPAWEIREDSQWGGQR